MNEAETELDDYGRSNCGVASGLRWRTPALWIAFVALIRWWLTTRAWA